MQRQRALRRSLAPLVLSLCVWFAWPAHALARVLLRLVHGVPGVGRVTASVDGRSVGSIGFGQSTGWDSVRTGRFTWALSGGGRTLASGSATVGDGAYDIVVLERGGHVRLGIYRARGGRAGSALVRVIHGAPEFGSPALAVDGQVVLHRLAYTQATPYLPLPAGSHTFAAAPYGRNWRSHVVLSGRLSVAADRSYSVIVLGTRGERVRTVTLVDRGAPLLRASTRRVDAAGSTGPGIVTVRPGDSLWSIAARLSGSGASPSAIQSRLVTIWNANARRIGTGDPNLIFPGTRLQV